MQKATNNVAHKFQKSYSEQQGQCIPYMSFVSVAQIWATFPQENRHFGPYLGQVAYAWLIYGPVLRITDRVYATPDTPK